MREHLIISGGEPASTIYVGRGIDKTLIDVVTSSDRSNIVILAQPSTEVLASSYSLKLKRAGLSVKVLTLPDGEEAKRLSVVEDAYVFLNDTGFTRGDMIIGVGGGALTDLAGFVGGTYLRGVSVVYVATTLTAAVDASIGGKTGVNVGGKNLAGLFSHPEAVLIDVNTIDELPTSLKRDGAAEALKTGFIEDMAIVSAYERDGMGVDLEEVINRSVAVKVSVVNDDFIEQSGRAILNYGHTVGHAIETATGRSHAESVSIGLVAAGAASQHVFDFPGVQRQRDALKMMGLPVEAPDADISVVRSLMEKDKKRDSDGIRMVLLHDFGIPQLVHVDDATVRAAFRGVGLA